MKKVVVSQLSYKDKISLYMAKDMWSNNTIEGLLPKVYFHDGPLGIRKPCYDQNGCYTHTLKSIAYPSLELLASTFNIDLARQYGEALASCAIEKGVDVVLGPGVNIKRLPLNGRNFEYFSEDPLLTGLLAKEYILGVQSLHVGSCLKHYCCNNSETSRNFKSMEVDKKTLNEIYLAPFRLGLQAKPWVVMTSYNKVNGIKMCEHQELIDKLRNDYHFDGLVISDWDAVFDSTKSINAGLEMEFPYSKKHIEFLLENEDKVDIKKLDLACKHILDFIYNNEKERRLRTTLIPIDKRIEIAKTIASEGIVLLKNKENVLPLNKNMKIYGTGRCFFKYACGGGSSKVIPTNVTLLGDVLKAMGIDINVSLALTPRNSTVVVRDVVGDIRYIKENNVDVSIISVGHDEFSVFEDANREAMSLTKEEIQVIKDISSVSKKTIVIVEGGGPIEMSSFIDDVDAIIYMGFSGQCGYEALGDILFGAINPSGKLSETFPIKETDFLSNSSYEDYKIAKYEEKLLVGYKDFIALNKKPLFPFGFGLSYSKFIFTNLHIIKNIDFLRVIVNVKNTSSIDGKEVVQVYISNSDMQKEYPFYELKGFKKVFIKNNSNMDVEIDIPYEYLMHYDDILDKFVLLKGDYLVMVGNSSSNIYFKQKVKI